MPMGRSTLNNLELTTQAPMKASGKVRSAGPPPIFSHARSTAGGSELARACTSLHPQPWPPARAGPCLVHGFDSGGGHLV